MCTCADEEDEETIEELLRIDEDDCDHLVEDGPKKLTTIGKKRTRRRSSSFQEAKVVVPNELKPTDEELKPSDGLEQLLPLSSPTASSSGRARVPGADYSLFPIIP